MNNKLIFSILTLSLIAIIGGVLYWFFILPQSENENITETPVDLFPFDQSQNGGQNTNNQNGGVVIPDRTSPLPILRLITREPVAGATAFTQASATLIRFNEKRLGDIFEANNTDTVVTRIDREVSEGIYDSHWVENGSGFIFRYVDEGSQSIRSIYGKLILETPPPPTDDAPIPLPEWVFTAKPLTWSITDIAVSPDTNSIFILNKTTDGIEGILAKPDGTSATKIFSSPLSEWLVSWTSPNTILLMNKPSHNIPGYLYTLNTTNARLTRVLGPLPGLTGLMSPDGKYILFATGESNSLETKMIDLQTNNIFTFPLRTLPEKCVWASSSTTLYCGADPRIGLNQYPDVWYKGLISFSDSLYEVDVLTFTQKQLINPFDFARVTIDATRPFLSPSENYLYFTNKKDSSLWSLELKKEEAVIIEDRVSTEN